MTNHGRKSWKTRIALILSVMMMASAAITPAFAVDTFKGVAADGKYTLISTPWPKHRLLRLTLPG